MTLLTIPVYNYKQLQTYFQTQHVLKNQRQNKSVRFKVTRKQQTYKSATNEILQSEKITNDTILLALNPFKDFRTDMHSKQIMQAYCDNLSRFRKYIEI